MEKTNTDLVHSILGKNINSQLGITENITEKYISFWIAGFSKACKGISVQPYHAMISADLENFKQILKKNNSVNNLYKEYGNYISCSLIKEEDNQYDSNAVIIAAQYPKTPKFYLATNKAPRYQYYLGYVPKIISKQVCQYFDLFTYGIISGHKQIDEELCSLRVSFYWQNNTKHFSNDILDCFASIVS